MELTDNQLQILHEIVEIPSWYSDDERHFPDRPDEQALLNRIERYFDNTECNTWRLLCDVRYLQHLVATSDKKEIHATPIRPSQSLPGHLTELRNSAAELLKKVGAPNVDLHIEKRVAGKRDSLLVEKGDGTDFTVMLYVHIDTVQPAKGWEKPYTLRAEGDRLRGLGAYDMKAGVMTVIEIMKTVKVPKGIKLIAAFCPDEERDSAGAISLLEWPGLHDVDLVLSPEIATLKGQLEEDSPKDVVANRVGHAKFLTKTSVPQGHLYTKNLPEAEAADVEIRNHLLQVFYQNPRSHQYFGDMIEELKCRGGRVTDSVGFSNTVESSRRWSQIILPPNSIKAALQTQFAVIQQLADVKKWTDQRINFSVVPDLTEKSYEPYCVNVYSDVAQAVLEGVTDHYGGYKIKGGGSTSDANIFMQWFSDQGKEVPMFEVGPVGGEPHSKDEYVSASSIANNIAWYRYMIEQKLPNFLAHRK